MKDFINKLTLEQLDLLNEINNDYQDMSLEELDEFLTTYFQEQGLEDMDNNPKQKILENILDILGEF